MSERVLAIEDEPAVQELLVDTLRDYGFAATIAASQEEAYAALGANAFHLVLLDLKLPATAGSMERSTNVGQDILKWIRERGIKKAGTDAILPVIVLTAFADFELIRASFRDLANDFLTKPFSPDLLAEAIDRAVCGDPDAAIAPSHDSLVRIAFHGNGVVQVETLTPISGKPAALLDALGQYFKEDVARGSDPARFRGVPQKSLAATLAVSDASVGKYVQRLRNHLSREFREKLRRSIHRQAVVEKRA